MVVGVRYVTLTVEQELPHYFSEGRTERRRLYIMTFSRVKV